MRGHEMTICRTPKQTFKNRLRKKMFPFVGSNCCSIETCQDNSYLSVKYWRSIIIVLFHKEDTLIARKEGAFLM